MEIMQRSFVQCEQTDRANTASLSVNSEGVITASTASLAHVITTSDRSGGLS